MNLDLRWWGRLASLLATEAALVVAVAWAAERWLRSPQVRRALWQTALLAVALLWTAELAGLRGQLAKLRPVPEPARTLQVRLLDSFAGQPVAEPLSEPFPDEADFAAPPPAPRPVWWPGWLWLAGLALLSGRLAFAHAGLAWCSWRSRDHGTGRRANVLDQHPLQDAGAPAPGTSDPTAATLAAQATADALRRPLGLGKVRVLTWPHLRGPVAFGVLRPTVALPGDFADRFSPAQREAMLAHELAHLAARDPLWLAIADVVCAVAWWHPAVWWARRKLRASCESAADEAAALVPEGRAALAESLVTFGRELASPRWARGIGVAGDGMKSQLARRVKALLDGSGDWRAVRPSRLWLARGMAFAATAMLMAVPWPGTGGPVFADVIAAAQAPGPATEVIGTDPTLPRIVKVEVLGDKVKTIHHLVPGNDGSPTVPVVFSRRDPFDGWRSFGYEVPTGRVESVAPAVYVALRDPLAEPAATQRATNGSALFTRRYKLEPADFPAYVAAVLGLDPSASATTNRPVQVQQDLRRIFEAAGVVFPEPTVQPTGGDTGLACFFNDRTGDLLVRATATDLDVIERLIQALVPPPTTEIADPAMLKTKANDERAEIESKLRSKDAELAIQALNTPPFSGAVAGAATNIFSSIQPIQPMTVSDVLGDPQFRAAPEALGKPDALTGLESKRRTKDVEIAALRTRYKDNHPKVREALAVQAELQKQIQALTPKPATPPAFTAVVTPRSTGPVPEAARSGSSRQIQLEIQFAEVTERGTDDLGLDWLFGQSPTNNPALQSGPATNLLTDPEAPHGQNLRVDLLRTEGQSATITAAQFAALRKRLEGRGGVDFLAAPKVITTSGRQARVSVSDVKTIVTGVDATSGTATNQAGINYQTEQVAVGPTVDIIPVLEGADARLGIIATVTEFLGYDQPKPGQEVAVPTPGGKPVKGVVPLPRLRVRATHADSVVKPGETIALRGPLVSDTVRMVDKVVGLGDVPLLGRLFRSESKSTVRKRLYVFVTPTEITATGEKK